VARTGGIDENERTQALQACAMAGHASVWPPTWRRAASDLPNLDLVIHDRSANDAEVMQHRSGRTGRAGRKGVSVPAGACSEKAAGAELLAGIWQASMPSGHGATADEIRKLDQERMLRDALFAGGTTSDDLILARALLAERSPRISPRRWRGSIGALPSAPRHPRSRPGRWPIA